MNFLSIFLTFFKIGAFTIGGGYAMLPLIQREICENKKWMSAEDFLDSISITNSLPGALVINAASFIGHRLMGLAGTIAAVCGCILPSLIIITVIAFIFDAVIDNLYVAAFFSGVKPAVVVIMVSAVIKLFKTAKLKGVYDLSLMLASFAAIAFLGISSVWLVILAAGLAIIIEKLREGRAEK